MAIANLSDLEYRLGKRGFRSMNAILHECPKCKVRGIMQFGIHGRTGGRDIELCRECGFARSFRNDSMHDNRVEDPGFDLEAFLR